MRIWGFGDRSDYTLRIFEGQHHPHAGTNVHIHPALWHWAIYDGEDNVRLVVAVHGTFHGFQDDAEAELDARDVVKGLGADFDDLTLKVEA